METGILSHVEFESVFLELKILVEKMENKTITKDEFRRYDEVEELITQHQLRTSNSIMLNGMLLSMSVTTSFCRSES